MRYSDILQGHVYNVIFDPVKNSEFNGKHLAVVIKKNDDNRTAIVAPLTSSSRDEGITKKNIGKISSLPVSLKTFDSFVVYNQVRTVNHDRFIALKEGDNRISSRVDPAIFKEIVSLCLNELAVAFEVDDAIDYHFSKYTELTIQKIVDSVYQIKRLILTNQEGVNAEEIERLISKVQFLNRHNIYSSTLLAPQDRRNGFPTLISEVLSGSVSTTVTP